jgi:hypothetical protein
VVATSNNLERSIVRMGIAGARVRFWIDFACFRAIL